MANKPSIIRTIYLYAISLVGLLMIVFSAADLINIGLKMFVFTQADEYNYPCPPPAPIAADGKEVSTTTTASQREKALCDEDRNRMRVQQRQGSLVRDLSMLIVAIPLFLFHFRIAQKERKDHSEPTA